MNALYSVPGGYAMYDPLGRRDFVSASPSGTQWLEYAGDQLVSEYIGGAFARRYVWGPGTDEPLVWYEGSGTSDRRWYYADERGSIIGVANASGTSIAKNAYDEYGIPASTNMGRFQYTGQQWLAELGMYHFKARTYSPTLGRFMQTDPIGVAGGVNLYAYVGADPVNGVDPSGLERRCEACQPTEDPDIVTGSLIPRSRGGQTSSPVGIYAGTAPGSGGSSSGGSRTGRTGGSSTVAQDGTIIVNAGALPNADLPPYLSAISNSGGFQSSDITVTAPWKTEDFVLHYYFGFGSMINLGDVGLGGAFENSPSVDAAVKKFEQNVLTAARPGLRVSYTTTTNVTNVPNLFAVGHSTFFQAASCNFSVCKFAFGIRDAFTDPGGIRIEFGGTPYPIHYYFTRILGY